MLWPRDPQYYQYLTYAFLHGGLLHIVGNMYFLYIFGNNVNDKLGHAGYVLFYLAGAIISGYGYAKLHPTQPAPVLGASGAVAAITGAYLVLFPQTVITVLYWFFFIGTIEVPALWFILIKLVFIDNLISRPAHVAYEAHLAGYAYGFVLTLFLLATHIVHSSNFDLWSMFRRWNRRRHYRDVVSSGYDPFSPEKKTRRINAKEIRTGRELDAEVSRLRSAISARIGERNLSGAADLYLQLMERDKSQILPRQHLLDIANQLASDQKTVESARAYEQFLDHYPTYEHAEQVELMLGIIYARYLNDKDRAMEHLKKASAKLRDPGQLRMCKEEMDQLKS